MENLAFYRQKSNTEAVVSVVRGVLRETGVALAVEAAIESLKAILYFIENRIGMIVDRQLRMKEIRENFKKVIEFLELGGDSRCRDSYNFCMLAYHIDSVEQRILFMSMVVSAFQHNPSQAFEEFSLLGGQMSLSYFSVFHDAHNFILRDVNMRSLWK